MPRKDAPRHDLPAKCHRDEKIMTVKNLGSAHLWKQIRISSREEKKKPSKKRKK